LRQTESPQTHDKIQKKEQPLIRQVRTQPLKIVQTSDLFPVPILGDAARSKDWVARLRVHLCYIFRHQMIATLASPRTFTELVQRRKLENHDLKMAAFADKVAVKSVVADMLGNAWVIPTLWSGTKLPASPPLLVPFVLKSRHGCNQNLFFRDGVDNWPVARKAAHKWLSQPYGQWLDEWLYGHIPRGLLVEPFVGNGTDLPIDYKIYTFGGQATHVQVHLERERRHRWMLFDRNWKRVSARTADPDPAPPHSLSAMLAASETLGAGFDFVRNDFYEIDGKPMFGEMTFYPGSGLDKFNPVSLDAILGQHWLDAGGR
jgi:TupA-like ATPgrasp